MIDYTRLTVTGSARRADVVVPSDEPVGSVLPRLIELLDEPEGTVARPLTLVGADGEPLDIARTPQQQGLADGTPLRLVRLDAAPPPPLVIDATDAAADAHDARPDRWDERSRLAVAYAAIGLATAGAGLALPLSTAGGLLAAHAGALVVLLAAAVGCGLARMPRVAAAFTAASAGLAVPLGRDAGLVAAPTSVAPSAGLIAMAAGLVAGSLVLLLGIGVGLRRRGALAGGTIGVVLGALLLVQLALGMPAVDAAAITGTVAAFLTGLLPWVSLSASGLTGLDQRAADGEPLPRARAAASIDDAYGALTWGVAATAASLALSGAVLVSATATSPWPGLLAAALALVAALRTRAFPLRAQVALLWASVAVIALTALLALFGEPGRAWIAVAAASAVAVLVAVAALVRPRPHQRARLRSLGNLVELIAVVALLPLVLGVFGIYADLLALFGGGA